MQQTADNRQMNLPVKRDNEKEEEYENSGRQFNLTTTSSSSAIEIGVQLDKILAIWA